MSELSSMYGQALFELAREEGKDERVLSEMDGALSVFQEEPQYVRLMDAYNVPKQERVALLHAAFAGQVDDLTLNFMKLLTERNALRELDACRLHYRLAYRAHHGIAEAEIMSAVPLDEAAKKRLLQALEKKTNKTIEACWVVDPALRGGLLIEVDGARYDNTIASQLSSLERLLTR